MSDELKPCPFCGCEMSIYTPNRDWHYLRGDHDENCIFSQSLMHPMVPCNENHRIMLVKDWNRRPTPEQSRETRDVEVRKRLDEYVRLRDGTGGCSDGGCVIKRPTGMHTNGGCKCSHDKYKAMRMMYAGQQLADALLAAMDRSALGLEG